MKGKITTVKELIDVLQDMPEDAPVYHIETINGEPQEVYFAVTHVYELDGSVMIY